MECTERSNTIKVTKQCNDTGKSHQWRNYIEANIAVVSVEIQLVWGMAQQVLRLRWIYIV